jgi:hypothetical protein
MFIIKRVLKLLNIASLLKKENPKQYISDFTFCLNIKIICSIPINKIKTQEDSFANWKKKKKKKKN